MITIRTTALGLLLTLAACSTRETRLPEAEVPLSRETLAGRWIMRRSTMVKTGAPDVQQTFIGDPATAHVQVFTASGAFSEPPDTVASTRGTFRITDNSVVVRTEDGDSTIWHPVRVSRHWLVQTTDHGSHDFDGDGEREWAIATYLYQRQDTP